MGKWVEGHQWIYLVILFAVPVTNLVVTRVGEWVLGAKK